MGGRLMGVRRMPPPLPIHFSVPHGIHLDDPEVLLRQSTKIGPLDTYRLDNGIVVASYPRLVFDLAANLTPLDLVSVVEQLLQREKVTVQSLANVARRLCHPMRPGSAQFLEMLLGRGARRAAESHPEVVLGEALRGRGIPVQPQYTDLVLVDGSKIRLDLAVPSIKWGIEIDVHPDHLLLEGTAKDKRRDRKCHRIGWQIERVTELDILDLESLLDELELLFKSRLDSFPSSV
jgi:very-short-patch-repair endonuclease